MVTHDDIVSGIGGGVIFASFVYWINYGEDMALFAALKQFVYSLVGSIVVVRFAKRHARNRVIRGQPYPAIIGALPAIFFALGSVFILHFVIKGTSNPLGSVALTFFVSPTSLWYFADKAAKEAKQNL